MGSGPGQSRLPFIGRRTECEWLTLRLEQAVGGQPSVALVCGEAGLGKTRLLREMRGRFEQGAAVFSGHCREHSPPPYLPIAEVLRATLDRQPTALNSLDSSEAKALTHILEGGPLAATETDERAADAARVRLYLAAERYFRALAEREPLVLIFDDLHWMDTPSLDLISHLVFGLADPASGGAPPILVCITHRPLEAGTRAAQALSRWRREPICQSLDLTGLTEMEVAALIRGAGFVRPSHQLLQALMEATGGSPLFVQEAMAFLERTNALAEINGSLVTTIPAREIRLPDEVTEAIEQHVASLSPDSRKLLSLASVLGGGFSQRSLEMVAGDRMPVGDVLAGVIEEGLVTESGESFAFSHALVGHVCYTRTPGPRRREMHRDVADALIALHGSDPGERLSEIAGHLVAAGSVADQATVLSYTRAAGDRAIGVFAWAEAARFYEAAATAAAAAPANVRARLHWLAAFTYYRDMDVGPALLHIDEALPVLWDSGDTNALVETLVLQIRCQLTGTAVPYGTMIDLSNAEAALSGIGDAAPHLTGQLLAVMSQACWNGRDTAHARATAAEALAIGERIGDHLVCSMALNAAALACLQSMDVQQAIVCWGDSLEHSAASNDPWAQGWSLARIPLGLFWCGRFAEEEATMPEARRVMNLTQDWAEYGQALAAEVCMEVARGRFDAAERVAQEAMTALQRSRYLWPAPMFLPALATARAMRGHWAEAEDALDLLAEPGQVFDEPGLAIAGMVQTYRQLLSAWRGEAVNREELAARAARRAGRAPADVGTLATVAALADTGALIGDDSVQKAGLAFADTVERGVFFTSGWVFLVPRVLGLGEAAAGRLDDAERHFQQGIEIAASSGALMELGLSCLDYASLLARRDRGGDRDEARDLLERARRLFSELGMTAPGPRAERLAQALGTAPGPADAAPPAYPDHLSEREVEVLRLIARGRANQQIADALILSPKTVARHVSNIFGKTGAENRSAATAYAFEKGLSGTG